MGDLQAPIINWQVKAGDSKAGFSEQRVLLIAQGSGTNPHKALIQDVQQTEVEGLCGVGSLAALAFNRFKKHNKANEIDIITLDAPAGGVAAQGGFKVTGAALENKTLKLSVGDDAFTVNVTILKGDTDAVAAGKIIAAINAASGIPMTAVVDGVDATLALVDFSIVGEVGNGLIVKALNRVLGFTFTEIQTTGGAGAYEVANIFDSLTKRYQTVLFDAAMDLGAVETWLESRFNMSNTVKGGSGFVMQNGTLAALKATVNALNSKTITVIGNPDEMKLNAIPMLAIAEFGAKRALRLTDGAVLGDLVVDAVEAFGGINKSSLPYHNTPMGYDAPSAQLTIEQVQDVNDAGLSLFVPATIGVVMGSLVTTYKFDNTGIADTTFKFLNAVDTSLAVQEYLFNNTQKEFGQTRATGGDLVAGVSMTNELSVAAYIVGLYQDMVAMALVQGGSAAIKSFKSTLTVSLDAASGTYTVFAPTAIVSQFRGLNGVIAISYNFQ